MYVMTYTLIMSLRDAGRRCHLTQQRGMRAPMYAFNRGNRSNRANLAAAYLVYRRGIQDQLAFPFRRGGDDTPDS